MKLALVHKRFGLDGGTERFLEGLTRGLSAREHDIEVFCGDVDPRFARVRMARFRRLPAGGPTAFWRTLVFFLAAALRVRRKAYDAVVHLGRTGPMDVYRAGGGSHRTWLDVARALEPSGLRRRLLSWSPRHRFLLWHERKALRSAARFVVPSERARRDLVEAYGAEAERVLVIPNGVDLDRFHPKGRSLFFQETRSGLGLRPEELVLVFVGSDFRRKGLDTVLRALQRLEDQDLRLLVVGGDRRRPEFEALAVSLGVRNRVAFLAEHPQPEKLYAAADLLVIPTRHDPFANVTLEALASGLPVISSSADGAAEEIGAGPALVVLEDPEDAEGLADAARRMLRPDGLGALREAAREAATRLSEHGCVSRWEALLSEVAAERARG